MESVASSIMHHFRNDFHWGVWLDHDDKSGLAEWASYNLNGWSPAWEQQHKCQWWRFDKLPRINTWWKVQTEPIFNNSSVFIFAPESLEEVDSCALVTSISAAVGEVTHHPSFYHPLVRTWAIRSHVYIFNGTLTTFNFFILWGCCRTYYIFWPFL